MYTPEQIVALVKQKGELSKIRPKLNKKEIPAYTPIYAQSVELAEKIAVHSQYDVFPEKLFATKAPNQDPAEFDYMKGIYPKPSITMPYWYKALAILNRIWNDANWSIKWQEDDNIFSDNTAQQYFEKGYKSFGSYENYHKEIYLPFKINDPNAIACYKPYEIPLKQQPNEDGSVTVVQDDTELLEPIEYIYGSHQVYGFKEDEYLLVLLDETSVLLNNQKGKIFEFYDEDAIYIITQVGKLEDNEYKIDLYYQHNLGILPCRKLKGRPVKKNNEILYLSYFLPAVSMLDEAVRNFSTKQMSTFANAYSIMWEYFDNCKRPGCVDGSITSYKDGEQIITKCSLCNGTGKRNKHSPTGVYQLEAPTRLNEGDAQIPTPPLGFVAPGTEILDFLKKEVEDDVINAFVMINLNVSNSDAKGSDVALSKQIDREEMFSFILQISNEVFSAFEFGINIMGMMRYGFKGNGDSYFQSPEISYPRTFEIRSESDLTTEISEAKKNGMPDIAIRELLEQYISKRFNTEENVTQVIEIVFATDRIVTKTDVDINARVAMGTIAKWEVVLHDSIYNFIEEAEAENENFFELPIEQAKAILIEKAKAKTAEITPVQNSAQNIIAGIAA